MLFTENLEQIVFNRHQVVDADEIVILSWYLWPYPVEQLNNLPFRSTVIYGMYGSEGIKPQLHKSLTHIQETTPQTLNIFYSKIPVHSKCYIWKKDNKIIHALIWSANFSTNWLTTPFREVLAETTIDTFSPLRDYLWFVLNNSISCLEGVANSTTASQQNRSDTITAPTADSYCLTLLAKGWETWSTSWLNWWQNPDNHTNPNDAYIAIKVDAIRNAPNLFPPKQDNPLNTAEWRSAKRHNDSVDIIRDDWTTMRWLLEWNQEIEWVMFPKQISSFPNKNELWLYLRNRLWVPSWQPVRKHHLEAYWRTDVKVSLIADWVYSFDFSNS